MAYLKPQTPIQLNENYIYLWKSAPSKKEVIF